MHNPWVEALQEFIDTILFAKVRKRAKEKENRSKELANHLKEEMVMKERLNNADRMLETTKRVAETIEKLCPELDAEKKVIALQSLMKDISLLASDQTLEISLLRSPIPSQGQHSQIALSTAEPESSI